MSGLVVFDCDGTLVDSQSAIVGAMTAAFLAVGRAAPDATAVRRVIGLSLDRAVEVLAPTESLSARDALVEHYRRAYAAQRAAGAHADPLYPGAVEALDELARDGWLLGVATGKSMKGLLATLERHGLRERFVTLQTADICRSKPDPHMVERAMEEAGARPRETVVVGDTVYDIAMARAAGAAAIGVAWGYHAAEELTAAGAHALLARFDELVPAVRVISAAE